MKSIYNHCLLNMMTFISRNLTLRPHLGLRIKVTPGEQNCPLHFIHDIFKGLMIRWDTQSWKKQSMFVVLLVLSWKGKCPSCFNLISIYFKNIIMHCEKLRRQGTPFTVLVFTMLIFCRFFWRSFFYYTFHWTFPYYLILFIITVLK